MYSPKRYTILEGITCFFTFGMQNTLGFFTVQPLWEGNAPVYCKYVFAPWVSHERAKVPQGVVLTTSKGSILLTIASKLKRKT